ncbi:MAG TPA: TOMM precursor leader peptide-binding protein [Thermoanaerobaculia bacterium]|nr:TOMM precursor leader peptide-binding protein [Thermoanaerobaculia bacterium]
MFKSCYEVEVVDGRHVLLLSERGNHLLTGSAYVILTELFGAGRDVDDLVDAAADRLSIAEVYYALARLETLGVIREAHDVLPRAAAAFWDALGVDATAVSQAIEQTTVTLLPMGEVTAHHLACSLAALGVGVGPGGDFCVALVDDYLRPELATLNQECLAKDRPWMLARPVGSILWLGPLVRPGKTGCWECMAHRMRGHRAAETYAQARNQHSHPRAFAASALPSTELAAAGLIATEIVKSLGAAASLEGVLLTIDMATLTTQRHSIIRRPQCPACGEGDAGSRRPLEPIRLASCAKQFTSDGGYRSTTPEAILEKYGRHVSRLTGVVSELTAHSSIDQAAAPLWFSGPNAARKDDTIDSLRGHFRAVSGGKGKTSQQAKAGALCEAIERYSGVFEGNEPRIRGSLETLGAAAIHPNACMLFSKSQFARRHESSTRRSSRVPMPFDESAEIEWSPLWSLTGERFRYLPTAYCYFDYPFSPFCWPDSNGCAAGNSPEEAILQGFLELVERDTVAMWWYNRVPRPAVDLESFDEPYFAAQQNYYRSLHRELWVLDITGDLGIPSFAAVSRRTGAPSEDIIFGFGCHLDANLGVLRALTEVNQMLPAALDRCGDPSVPLRTTEDEVLSWLQTATVADNPFLFPDSESIVSAGNFRQHRTDDLRDDIETCVRVAAERGLETLVLDQTRPDIGLSVVRVVVPGMRHFWQRLGPGRLYDVPVTLGWLPAPLAEEELNPVPVCF